MTPQVTQLWRYPVKSHGREALERVRLTAGQTLPWDRLWAVAHDNSSADGSEWVPCQNFTIGTKAPKLAALNATVNEATGLVTLTHPELGTLEFDPDQDGEALIAWAGGLVPKDRAQSSRLIRARSRGFTDTEFPSVSLMNMASHRAVETKLEHACEPERWRGNVWLDGFAPWAEFDWIGKTLRIGTARILIRERVVRCKHTMASPKTGERDIETLSLLRENWGHQDFGVYGEVIETGDIRLGDTAEVL